jgi:cytochrome c oxidase assembly protein subunit 15
MAAFPQQLDDTSRRQVAVWLTICCAMVFAMVILGGVTRLTDSGLSMVEWDPIFGAIPPLSQQDWETVFAKYRESPEYLKINVGMDLDGFKSIYWFEYSHRVLGRSIGTVFLLPFLYFLWRRKLTPPLIPKLALAFVLGGLQGLLGWYMVKSGLVDNPHVSQYRLTAHLGLALVIYAYLLWILFDLVLKKTAHSGPATIRLAAGILIAMIALTISSGGFVAGLKAGHAYNTFPLMGDQWLPPAGWSLEPGWRNLFENIATVQFVHRVLAITTCFAVFLFWLNLLRHRLTLPGQTRIAANLFMLMAIAQVALGISTLLLLVPIPLAATHQGGALVLLTLALLVYYRLQAGNTKKSPV